MFNVSIIICCYGGEKTIEECLNSLLNQKINSKLFEVIIVDDGSLDNTSTIVKNFIKTKLSGNEKTFKYYRKKNEGLSIARNFGVNKSSSELVVFIDEDAWAYSNYLGTIIDFFNVNQMVNCVGGKIDLYNDENNFAKLIQDSIFSYSMKVNKDAVIGTNMAFRKSFLQDVGGFQPEFTYRGDESALFAKAKNSIIIGRCDTMKVKHFQPSNSEDWLKTRFENGYFGAAIDFLIKNSIRNILFNILIRLIFISVPYFILFGLVLAFVSPIFATILLLGVFLYLSRKFILSGYILRIIKELRINRNDHTKIKDEFYLSFLIILGIYKENVGYVKGCLAFSTQKWKK
jgi:glycosyltransferase involved in cell wall biosynthesis